MPPETDVTAAETTAPESSPEIETSTTEAAQTAAPVEEKAEKMVPYERFHEVNEKAKRVTELEAKVADLQAKLDPPTPPDANQEAIRTQLRQMGFVSQEEINATLKQRDEDARVDRELSQLESKYDGSDGKPKFNRAKVLQYAIENGIGNAEIAYKSLHDTELTDWAIQQAVTKTRGVKTEGSDGSGSSQVGLTNDDLRAAIATGDKTALRTLIKRATFGKGT